jgi:hypothetical protein
MNLLGQNPYHHVTATNGLAGMVLGLRDSWTRDPAFLAQGLETVQPRIVSATRGMMYGFYEKELSARKVVFDKSRAWTSAIEVLDLLFPDRPPPIIVTVRDVRAIVASFESLYRANPMTRMSFAGPAFHKAQTVAGRAEVLLSESGVIGHSINSLRDAMHRIPDRLIVIPYRQLASDPKKTLTYLHARLMLPAFDYDPDHVEQITQEDDVVHGWGPTLHTIRSQVAVPESEPWFDVLPPPLVQGLGQVYSDINNLAGMEIEGVEVAEEAI